MVNHCGMLSSTDSLVQAEQGQVYNQIVHYALLNILYKATASLRNAALATVRTIDITIYHLLLCAHRSIADIIGNRIVDP